MNTQIIVRMILLGSFITLHGMDDAGGAGEGTSPQSTPPISRLLITKARILQARASAGLQCLLLPKSPTSSTAERPQQETDKQAHSPIPSYIPLLHPLSAQSRALITAVFTTINTCPSGQRLAQLLHSDQACWCDETGRALPLKEAYPLAVERGISALERLVQLIGKTEEAQTVKNLRMAHNNAYRIQKKYTKLLRDYMHAACTTLAALRAEEAVRSPAPQAGANTAPEEDSEEYWLGDSPELVEEDDYSVSSQESPKPHKQAAQQERPQFIAAVSIDRLCTVHEELREEQRQTQPGDGFPDVYVIDMPPLSTLLHGVGAPIAYDHPTPETDALFGSLLPTLASQPRERLRQRVEQDPSFGATCFQAIRRGIIAQLALAHLLPTTAAALSDSDEYQSVSHLAEQRPAIENLLRISTDAVTLQREMRIKLFMERRDKQ